MLLIQPLIKTTMLVKVPPKDQNSICSNTEEDIFDTLPDDDPLDSWPNEYRFGLAWFATTRLLVTADVTTGLEEPKL